MVGGGKDREEMSRLIDINDERFWDILFDEACVEGNQAERIKTELEKIVAFDTEKVVTELKETRKTALNKVKMPIMIICKHDLQEFADICFEESIDIVKKGGVE